MSTLRTLRMILNTFYSGPQAWFFLADDRGYLREAGIAIEFTEGDTAANAVPRVAGGGFDLGYGDMNALIECAGTPEGCAARAVFATFTASPYTIAVPAASAIRHPRDLPGHTLASHPNDAAMRMLPELALACGFDAARVAVEVTAQPHPQMLGELFAGRWTGMFGFVNTLRAAAIEAGHDPGRLRFLEYRDFVPDLYGSALLVHRRLAAGEPDLVKRLVGAINRGIADTLRDLDAAIDAVAGRNPAIDRRANRARLAGTLGLEMSGATTGLGDVDDARLARAIALIVRAKGLPRTPAAHEIFDRRFLPDPADRVATPPRAPA